MIDDKILEFENKLYNKEYVSKKLFQDVKKELKDLTFDLDRYNNMVLKEMYDKCKDYFDYMYNGIDESIHLDEEQIMSILADEDCSLILAGAGTGKTTTIVSKVKYLVDKKHIDPEKILVISYTKKATEELIKRIFVDFKIPATISTFHSMGYEYIRNYFKNKKCYVIDENTKNDIFLTYFKNKIFSNKEKLSEIMQLFDSKKLNKKWLFGQFMKDNFSKYENFDEYFNAYKEKRRLEVLDLKSHISSALEKDYNAEHIYTLKNELVKSKGEAMIANYLFTHGIEYNYEKIYKDIVDDYKVYKTDFTLNLGGEEIYIEYFGLSNYKLDELNTYQRIKQIKDDYHLKHKNKYISIDYMSNENIIETLENELIKYGFKFKVKTDEEIYDAILNRNPLAEIFPLKEFFYDLISCMKSSYKREGYKYWIQSYLHDLEASEKQICEKQATFILDFYDYYCASTRSNDRLGIDFDDMLFYGKRCLSRLDDEKFKYQHLIIDEYQDISFEKFDLVKTILNKSSSKITAVGDDWQTIYSYSGSKISFIYNFEKNFEGAKIFYINKTYRNSQELINYTGTFIMKNKNQIKKQLVSDKHLLAPIKIIEFEANNELLTLKSIIEKIHIENPDHNILILARTNKVINNIFNDQDFFDDVDTKVKFMNYNDLLIDAMTIHKSKGLTADEVIIFGLDSKFPSYYDIKFWMFELFANKVEKEYINYAEERRIFYVALTRTKNYVYLLANKDYKDRSIFVCEIENIMKKVNNNYVINDMFL